MKNITWVTPDCFVDCDLNPDVFKIILRNYTINWIILLPNNNSRYKVCDFDVVKKLNGLNITFKYYNYKHSDPRITFFYLDLYKEIKKTKYDLLYLNLVPGNPFRLPLFWLLDKSKTIFAAHDGDVKEDVSKRFIVQKCFDLVYPYVKYVNMFSPSQAETFKQNYPKAQIFMNLLSLKNYGECKLSKRKDCIVFFCFGTLHEGKNIELLINAACNLYERGYRGFKISINGSCPNWNYYKDKIIYPDIFECTIRMIENSEIPILFTENHYMVLPYKIISQSGALKVAFNYNIPVIVSDLKGFTDEVKEGINGYIFKNQDQSDLEKILIDRIEKHHYDYSLICEKMKTFTKNNYSNEALATKIEMMYSTVLVKNNNNL